MSIVIVQKRATQKSYNTKNIRQCAPLLQPIGTYRNITNTNCNTTCHSKVIQKIYIHTTVCVKYEALANPPTAASRRSRVAPRDKRTRIMLLRSNWLGMRRIEVRLLVRKEGKLHWHVCCSGDPDTTTTTVATNPGTTAAIRDGCPTSLGVMCARSMGPRQQWQNPRPHQGWCIVRQPSDSAGTGK